MKRTYPSYYPLFRCLAGACPDSCCKDWAVDVDPDTAAFYRVVPGALGDSLRASLRQENGDTILSLMPNGRCPMWQADGLCRIQRQLGEVALCQVCRTFPRLQHDYGCFIEQGLELSCPEAARLILSQTQHSTVTEEIPGGTLPEYDTDTMTILLQGRQTLHTLLDDPRYTPQDALCMILLHSRQIQSELDGAPYTPFHPETALPEARKLASTADPSHLLSFYRELEILTPRWKHLLQTPTSAPWSRELIAIAHYGIDRYYLQAISDYDLMGRMKMILAGCILLRYLGGTLIDTAQLYAKEIENDPDNVESLLAGAYNHPALSDRYLLGLLEEPDNRMTAQHNSRASLTK